jgi:hypothetical protein
MNESYRYSSCFKLYSQENLMFQQTGFSSNQPPQDTGSSFQASNPLDTSMEEMFDVEPPPTPFITSSTYETRGLSTGPLKEDEEEDDDCMIVGESQPPAVEPVLPTGGREVSRQVRQMGNVKYVTVRRVITVKKEKNKVKVEPHVGDVINEGNERSGGGREGGLLLSPVLCLLPPPSVGSQSGTSDYATLSSCSPKTPHTPGGSGGSAAGTPSSQQLRSDYEDDPEFGDLPPVFRALQVGRWRSS